MQYRIHSSLAVIATSKRVSGNLQAPELHFVATGSRPDRRMSLGSRFRVCDERRHGPCCCLVSARLFAEGALSIIGRGLDWRCVKILRVTTKSDLFIEKCTARRSS